ncbi:MAG: bifunctional [glutamate--ammonia ligase]-adenylyl-L-tyrosine phosphorylase/[glutamate--ammonia-ligase] adenylyltransferase [Deltaproteobacteria bacterium]|nr:bifunctional [glutamate--ammonia ligase]-adenylyl-L-tyrosine phosphorylase/[glutamate--ammonia-ligase] adenylyltransferase [Deltaproteobacteria bacterium]MBW1825752.1 bifunctional [glutamate--ammonia ligase]-adenylyl-L-tyrosine phosphorylase/[glutamate--ammonia-ligase] adenylyltransferase [Deltaproteobacteria bacterium]MBW2196487.1 bifunctional [glutamate--ammonia ligase]-adenylyl-L-tyrosine phosphorylase/[glutamate--ammonia-ligase] adenylyltransferase [Deltaproteobacteria bacterium]MBW222569
MKLSADIPQVLRENATIKFEAFFAAAQDANVSLPDDPEFLDLLKRVFTISDFISKICIRSPEVFIDLLESGDLQKKIDPDAYDSKLEAHLFGTKDDAQLSARLRRFRRREMVRIAWRDLAGWADLSETMADLSALADTCIDQAVSFLYEWQCSENGIPTGDDGSEQRLVVFGMGKLGGLELNFSSDVDLIFTYPETGATQGASEPMSNEEFFVRLCRRLIKIISANTPDGFVFRVDTDLRPFGENGPLVMSFDAMEEYYQAQGRDWERYAWIKARVVAGDKPAGAQLLERLKPFIYRRYLDFGAFESLRSMKQKISLEVKRKGIANNIKLGPGGIREIEFFGQIFQLIRGGVTASLQERSIQKVLGVLAHENHIHPNVCDELTNAYIFLRNTEHRLQEFSDQQTHRIPSDPAAKARLAASLGFDSPESFDRRLEKHRGIVHDHFNKLLGTKDSEPADNQDKEIDAGLETIWKNFVEDEDRRKILDAAGYEDPDGVKLLLDYLRNHSATRSLSSGGRNRLDELMPLMLKAIGRSEQPNVVLNRIVDLIKTIEQRTNYLALLLENPAAIVHLVKFASASPWIISFLSHHPILLDELLDPRTLYLPPEKSELVNDMRRRFDPVAPQDLEYQIQELCIFKQVNTLRVAAADVTGALTLMRTSDHLTEIAETVLNEVVELAWNHLIEKHGSPTCRLNNKTIGRGFSVIAYGKLGGIEFGYGSDLDMVFLHAGTEGRTCGGRRSIDNHQFFARLGQRVIHILTTHTPAGMLYEPDMRLRPSGSSGILVSHIDGFKDYQIHKAWTWEHQALIKARPITGDEKMAERFEQIRNAVLAQPRIKTKLREEVVDMRERMRRELLKPETGFFDLKQDIGGIVDIEFLVQYLVLLNSWKYRELLRWTDTVRLLETLNETGIIDGYIAHILKVGYLTYRATVHQHNLQEKSAKVSEDRFRGLRKNVEEIWENIMKTV